MHDLLEKIKSHQGLGVSWIYFTLKFNHTIIMKVYSISEDIFFWPRSQKSPPKINVRSQMAIGTHFTTLHKLPLYFSE